MDDEEFGDSEPPMNEDFTVEVEAVKTIEKAAPIVIKAVPAPTVTVVATPVSVPVKVPEVKAVSISAPAVTVAKSSSSINVALPVAAAAIIPVAAVVTASIAVAPAVRGVYRDSFFAS